ncbi:GtrA family protein [Henriciella sp. AS95]|uniref:GtrA family protein n=1 Tax=Henriciella sp. AS95 TaxID=3135782 RepID=UPI00317B3EB2
MKRFIGFLSVGVVGFLVDAGVLLIALQYLGPYSARAISFAAAVATTYTLNRLFVFRAGRDQPGWATGFGLFVAANSVGGAINLGVYSLLVASGLAWISLPLIATGIGSVAGAVANFTLTARFVFPVAKAFGEEPPVDPNA